MQGTTSTTKHVIRLKSDRVIHQKPYPMTPHKKSIFYEQIAEMLQAGVIEPSHSSYSSPPVIIERPEKKPRFCIDYRQLNDITEDEPSVLPKIPETLRDLGTAKVFTLLDLKAGYWQIPMDEQSKHLTAFSTPDGALYQFRVMPFGLKGAPSTFQKLVTHEVLVGYLHKFAKVYLDDILVYSDTIEDHQLHLRLVLERLRIHNLQASPEKCVIAASDLHYLGHRITGSQILPQTKHIVALLNFPTPRTKKQLQSLLGTLNWIREYIPDVATITKPMTELLRKNTPFKWTPECEASLQLVKHAASQPLELHRPDPQKPFILQTDGSLKGLAAVLYQEGDDGQRQIISYASSTLTPTESRYHINEIEMLAVVWAIKRYRVLLEDRRFILRTDSRALLWLRKFRDSKTKLTRWALLLQEYDFEIQHCPGKNNELPDLLSRNPEDTDTRSDIDLDRMLIPEFQSPAELTAITTDTLYQQVVEKQIQSARIQRDIRRWTTIQARQPQNPTEQRFLDSYLVRNNTLYRMFPDGERLIVPRSIQQKVIYHHHDVDTSAHPGALETLRQVQQHYYWRDIRHTVNRYVKRCILCSTVKTRTHPRKAPLQPHVAEAPFNTISLDILGPYPETPNKNKFAIVAVDIYSKWIEAKSLPTQDINQVLRFLREEITHRYGPPQRIITDRHPMFKSRKLQRYCSDNGIEILQVALEHQRANPVERKVQDLKKILRAIVPANSKTRWDEYLTKAVYITRTRKNLATQETPGKILLGYELSKPGDWKIPQYRHKRRTARRIRTQDIVARQQRYLPKYVEPRPPDRQFRQGQKVLVRRREPELQKNPFSPLWEGPHEVTRKVSPLIYEILRNGFLVEYHIDDIRIAPPGNPNAEDTTSTEGDNDSDFPPTDPEIPTSSDDDEPPDPPRKHPQSKPIPDYPYPTTDTSQDDEPAPQITVAAQVHRPASPDPQIID